MIQRPDMEIKAPVLYSKLMFLESGIRDMALYGTYRSCEDFYNAMVILSSQINSKTYHNDSNR